MSKKIGNIIDIQKRNEKFLLVQKQLHLLQQIIYHIDNLARAPIETCDWSQNEKRNFTTNNSFYNFYIKKSL